MVYDEKGNKIVYCQLELGKDDKSIKNFFESLSLDDDSGVFFHKNGENHHISIEKLFDEIKQNSNTSKEDFMFCVNTKKMEFDFYIINSINDIFDLKEIIDILCENRVFKE